MKVFICFVFLNVVIMTESAGLISNTEDVITDTQHRHHKEHDYVNQAIEEIKFRVGELDNELTQDNDHKEVGSKNKHETNNLEDFSKLGNVQKGLEEGLVKTQINHNKEAWGEHERENKHPNYKSLYGQKGDLEDDLYRTHNPHLERRLSTNSPELDDILQSINDDVQKEEKSDGILTWILIFFQTTINNIIALLKPLLLNF